MTNFPATLAPAFIDEDGDEGLLELAIGEDLILHVAARNPVKSNDAGEKFTEDAIHVELFDGDHNLLATIGRARTVDAALAVVPALIPVAQRLYPDHVISPEERP